MLTALTVRAGWERGTMEQLAATPVHPLEVIAGSWCPTWHRLIAVSVG